MLSQYGGCQSARGKMIGSWPTCGSVFSESSPLSVVLQGNQTKIHPRAASVRAGGSNAAVGSGAAAGPAMGLSFVARGQKPLLACRCSFLCKSVHLRKNCCSTEAVHFIHSELHISPIGPGTGAMLVVQFGTVFAPSLIKESKNASVSSSNALKMSCDV